MMAIRIDIARNIGTVPIVKIANCQIYMESIEATI